MGKAFYAIACLAFATLATRLVIAFTMIQGLRLACIPDLSRGPLTTKACAEFAGGMSAIQAIANNIGPVEIPWYTWLIFAVAAIAPFVFQLNRVAVACVAIAIVGWLVGDLPISHTNAVLQSRLAFVNLQQRSCEAA